MKSSPTETCHPFFAKASEGIQSCEVRGHEEGWRAMTDDDEHYVYAIAL